MIDYERYTLDNGLTVILHDDKSTPLVTVNILYKVGSRNEQQERTGFAHLFEHLMFGGSKNAQDFDAPIQQAGGDSNAFTNSDITNYYNVLPASNLETALWLESDRMLQLNIDQKSLDIQKKVVVEEFKETCINKPYGDLWHELSALSYTKHPYRWPTIGLVPEHIEEAHLKDVQAFYSAHYRPNNAVLVLVGNLDIPRTKEMIEKWFGDISKGDEVNESILVEPVQQAYREKTLYKKVPTNSLYMAFHMPERQHKHFITYDILSDILGGGRSSRLYKNLVKNSDKFVSAGAYITGTFDPGLFIVEAKLADKTSIEEAKAMIWKELEMMKEERVPDRELQKVKNSLVSSVLFSEVSISHKAINLAYYEMLGDVSLINHQEEEVEGVSVEDISLIANDVFRKENCTLIEYLKEEEQAVNS